MISDSTPDRPEFSLAGVERCVVDLEGSIFGECLKEHLGKDVDVAPTLGVGFVDPWTVEWPDSQSD